MKPLAPPDIGGKRTRATGGAVGYTEANQPKVSVAWTRELFDAINKIAKENKTSFAHEVRKLCAIGLQQIKPNKRTAHETHDTR